jgi:hypothetical protein
MIQSFPVQKPQSMEYLQTNPNDLLTAQTSSLHIRAGVVFGQVRLFGRGSTWTYQVAQTTSGGQTLNFDTAYVCAVNHVYGRYVGMLGKRIEEKIIHWSFYVADYWSILTGLTQLSTPFELFSSLKRFDGTVIAKVLLSRKGREKEDRVGESKPLQERNLPT